MYSARSLEESVIFLDCAKLSKPGQATRLLMSITVFQFSADLYWNLIQYQALYIKFKSCIVNVSDDTKNVLIYIRSWIELLIGNKMASVDHLKLGLIYTGWLKKVSCCIVIDISMARQQSLRKTFYHFANSPGLKSWQH